MSRILIAATFIFAGFASNSEDVAATIIDFESLAHPGSDATSVDSPYIEDGFILSSTRDFGQPVQVPFLSWGSASPNFAGSTGLHGNLDQGSTLFTLSRLDGSSFDVASIDLSSIFFNPPQTTLLLATTFFGERSDSTFVEVTVSARPFFGFRTFALPGLTDIVSLQWRPFVLSGITVEPHQFDNIVIVPESNAILTIVIEIVAMALFATQFGIRSQFAPSNASRPLVSRRSRGRQTTSLALPQSALRV